MEYISDFANRLKEYREKKEITLRELSEITGVPAATLNRYELRQRKPKIDTANLIAKKIGINPLWLSGFDVPITTTETIPLIEQKNYTATMYRIPILGSISAGMPLFADQNIEGYTFTDAGGSDVCFALRVKGDSMNAARIDNNDILIVRRQDTVENGDIAVVLVNDNDAVVKRFYQADNIVTLIPQSTNPEYSPQIYDLKNTKIKIVGKVIRNQIEF